MKKVSIVYLAFLFSLATCRNYKLAKNRRQHHKKTAPTLSPSLEPLYTTSVTVASGQDDVTVNVTSETTNEPITLRVGNHTINTNLKSALDDIAPGQVGKGTLSGTTYAPFNGYYEPKNTKKNASSVLFEVINIEPFIKGRKYNTRFVVLITIYATAALGCILITYCVVKTVMSKRTRHRQYMLLTKRDMEFPLGGGGI